jgi:hypothetical protein
MDDMRSFEDRFAARLVRHASVVPRQMDAHQVARDVIAAARRRPARFVLRPRGSPLASRPLVAWVVLLALLLLAVVAMLGIGSLLIERDRSRTDRIVVARSDGLFVASPDGTSLRAIRTDGSYVNARVSTSGRHIAASFLGADPGLNTLRILLGDGTVTGILDTVQDWRWSPVRDQLAVRTFESFAVVEPDGSESGRPALPADLVAIRTFAWSPDGDRLVVSACTSCPTDGGPRSSAARDDLWVSGFGGVSAERITDSPDVTETSVAWSPDHARVAYATDLQPGAGIEGELWLVDVSSGRRTRLVPEAGPDATPDWSPDGRSILYHATVRGQRDVFLVDVDGGQSRALTGDPADEWAPEWSPAGDRILYWRSREIGAGRRVTDLWTMRSDGSDPIRVAEDVLGTGDWMAGP